MTNLEVNMNKRQWFVFAIGALVLSFFLELLSLSWGKTCTALTSSSLYTACIIKEQSYTLSAIIFVFVALTFFICASLEKQKK